MPVIDRTLVAAIIGPLVGILVANGYIAPENKDQVQQLIDGVIGGAIALISLIGFFMHHRATTIQKMKQDQNTSTEKVEIEKTITNPSQNTPN